ncbi:SAM-dependent methyltransferase [Shimazuella sp. AN120528]|uniref:class I SAM-dependent methyltransferase n=1 Tax=Shimazuella soli TaxID=1892854 RepID=UPI001F0FDF3B|nr:methyltransferase domain-containing protein [Shimazuella soli]MCH5586658.1 SAM-dependent methyltransferase [Shimazuella soli]
MKSSSIRIVIGASSYRNNPDWIHTQKDDLDLLNRGHWLEQFEKNNISAILAEHVWEHLTYEQGIQAATTCFEFLKPGGYIRCAVPDGNFPDQMYQQLVQIGGPGPKDHPAATHQIVFTYQTLQKMFHTAGFQTKLLEYCDENGHFHHYPWNPNDGVIYRSFPFDHRNQKGKLGFVSLILDAIKPLRA